MESGFAAPGARRVVAELPARIRLSRGHGTRHRHRQRPHAPGDGRQRRMTRNSVAVSDSPVVPLRRAPSTFQHLRCSRAGWLMSPMNGRAGRRPCALAAGMSSLPAQIATAAALFAGTNIDDLVVLSLLSASSRAGGRRATLGDLGRPVRRLRRPSRPVSGGRPGPCAGPGALALAARPHPARPWRRHLVAAIRSLRRGEQPKTPSAGGLLGVAALTIVDGADDLAAYTPFFAATAAPRSRSRSRFSRSASRSGAWRAACSPGTRESPPPSAATATGSSPRPSSSSPLHPPRDERPDPLAEGSDGERPIARSPA